MEHLRDCAHSDHVHASVLCSKARNGLTFAAVAKTTRSTDTNLISNRQTKMYVVLSQPPSTAQQVGARHGRGPGIRDNNLAGKSEAQSETRAPHDTCQVI